MRLAVFLIIVFNATCAWSQRQPEKIYFSGSILGYHYEPGGFLRHEEVELQGGLSNATITVTSGGKQLAHSKTDNAGRFAFHVPIQDKLVIKYSKKGYARSSIQVNMDNLPQEMFTTGLVLEHLELILNDNQTETAIDNGKIFASINYGSSRIFSVSPVEFGRKERLFKDVENSTPVKLLKRSVGKNSSNNKEAIAPQENGTTEHTTSSNNYRPITNASDTAQSKQIVFDKKAIEKKLKTLQSDKFGNVDDWKNLSVSDLELRSDEINSAWKQLEKDKLTAVSEEDFIIIEAKEELLLSAERELEAAKAYIEEQEGKLSAQRNFMIILVIMMALMAGFVFYLIKSIREKKKTNAELDKKNKKITASITYAQRIQRSVLPKDEHIRSMLPNSFVFYEPRDIVSGDFYWFHHTKDKIIMSAIDCTGHGVPGAFMSLIGNTLMNQIVKEKGITRPSEILKALHDGVVKSLDQEEDKEAAQDGMDMAVCLIDQGKKELVFSGAMNPAYVVSKGKVEELGASVRGIGGVSRRRRKKRTIEFSDQTYEIQEDTSVYLFSDGYMDQFGGANKEKFNISRFKELLLEINNLPMSDQRERIEKAFQQWKGNVEQVDDVLVIGARV